MTPRQTATAETAGSAALWRRLCRRLRPLCMLAAMVLVVFSGCERSGSREAQKMDGINDDPSVAVANSEKQTRALIPPIDLIEPAQTQTATFALG